MRRVMPDVRPEISRRRLFARSCRCPRPLPQLLSLQARGGAQSQPAAKRVLVIYEQGGLSHMDTWDPKPEAPVDHRSPHRPIATSVPGLQFTALLPHTARFAHKLAVVRSMHHAVGGADAHPNGTQYALSGAHPSSLVVMPDIGSTVSRIIGTENPRLPPYIMVPGNHEQAVETRTGFLPASPGQSLKVIRAPTCPIPIGRSPTCWPGRRMRLPASAADMTC
ncbi:MAG: DUF1501 domain-containing protein [Planctomycetaceae bacterium]